MGLRDLIFTIRADNKAAPALDAVREDLRDTAGAAATLSDRVSRAGKGLAMIGAAGSVVSVGLQRIFRDSLSLYDTQAKAEARVAQAIRSTGMAAGLSLDQFKARASELQNNSLFGDEAILGDVTAPLLAFDKLHGEVFDRAQQAVVDMAAATGGGLSDAAKKVGKALQDPARSMGELSEAGITFSAAQEAVVKRLVETGREAEAQALILARLNQVVGGQAAAAAAAGLGPLEQLANSWGDVREQVGFVVSQVLPPLVSGLKASVSWLQSLSPETKRFAIAVGGLAVVLPPVVAVLGGVAVAAAALGGPITAAVVAVGLLSAAAFAFRDDLAAAWRVVRAQFQALPEWANAAFQAVARAVKIALAPLATLRDAVVSLGSAIWSIARPDETPEIAAPLIAAAKDAETATDRVLAAVDGLGAGLGDFEFPDLPELDVTAPVGSVKAAADAITADLARIAEKTEAEVKRTGQAWASGLSSLIGDFEAAGAGAERLRDRITDAIFEAAVSPAFEQLAASVSGALSGASGGGGFFGSLAGLAGSALKLPGFATGGAFTVGGRAGRDRQPVALALSRGERVEVRPRGQASASPVNVYIQTPDARSFAASRAQVGRTIGRAVAAGQRGA